MEFTCPAHECVVRIYSDGTSELYDPLPSTAAAALKQYCGELNWVESDMGPSDDAMSFEAEQHGFSLLAEKEFDFRTLRREGRWDLTVPEPEYFKLYAHDDGRICIEYAEFFVGHWCRCAFVLSKA